MKDTPPQQGHITPVASEACHIPSLSNTNTGQGFDDDDNEGWELGVGNLIIDLDADLERNNTSPISDPSPSSKMSSFEHQATVDKAGLKMKIKRKSGGKSSDNKHEIVKNDLKLANISEAGNSSSNSVSDSAANTAAASKTKTSPAEKGAKGRGGHKKEKMTKDKAKCDNSNSVANGFQNHGANSDITSSADNDKLQQGIKREATPSLDPYEFNAKVEDRISVPVKKIKMEKLDPPGTPGTPCSSISAPSVDASTATSHVGTITEPDCLGACEPGTSVCLEGIVWQETENGVLVVNVTWRGKTYVGTLLDATKHDWAPPRFSCDSPTSDMDVRTPKRGGGKRGGRGSVSTPVNDTSLETRKLRKGRRGNSSSVAPPSPAKSDISQGGLKRKGRPTDLDISIPDDAKLAKRYRSNSRGTPTNESVAEPAFIECPEPNCNKKYRHINGLRYHQSHAHPSIGGSSVDDKDKGNSSDDSRPSTPLAQISVDKPVARKTPKSKDNAEKSKNNQKTDTESKSSAKETNSDNNKSTNSSTKDSTMEKLKSTNSSTKDSTMEKLDSTMAAKNNSVDSSTVNNIVSASSCVTSSSQIYQISGTSVTHIRNLTVVQKPVDVATHLIGQSTANTITAVTVPITTVATLPAQIVPEREEKKRKGEKGKSKITSQRPIVPATAIPQVITFTTNGPLTHSTMAAPQISPTSNLKPIQPKPSPATTEPSTVNTALAGLQKEKKPKKKKKAVDKDSKLTSSDVKNDVAVKGEPKSVIKPNPSVQKNIDSNEVKKTVDKTKADSSATSDTQQTRISQPPASLTLNSPVIENVQEPQEPGNENVQSPAYSDISDANESTPQESEGEGKPVKEPPKCSTSESVNPPERTSTEASMKPYGMYSYYGQSSYLMPSTQSSSATPPCSKTVNDKSPKIDSSNQDSSNKSLANVDTVPITSPKDDGLLKNIKKEVIDPPQTQDYQHPKMQQQHQQLQQQQPQMYARGLSHQYSYMGAYGYAMDPAYHMHLMATDPHYKQQHEMYMEEQERLRKEQCGKTDSLSSPGVSGQHTSSSNKPTGTDLKSDDNLSRTASPKTSSVTDCNKLVTKSGDSKKSSEHNIPQPMNLQKTSDSAKNVTKEGVTIKQEIVSPKELDPNLVQEQLREKHQEELQRYYMYQQQKIMEQQRVDDDRKRTHIDHNRQKSEVSRIEKPHSGKATPDKLIQKDSTVPGKVSTPHDTSKRDSSADRARDSSGSRDSSASRDIKRDEKHRVDDKRGSPSMTNKMRDMVPNSAGHSGANMGPGPYPGYMSHPYLQNPHYAAQLHYVNDPNHPIYRGMGPVMGYPGHPGHPYMHPAQIRYISPVDHPDKDKVQLPSPGSMPGPALGAMGEQPKALDLLQQHASYYASQQQQHKIHELEKVKADPRVSPKVPEGSPLPKSKSEYTNSPPPMRHLHTHHHTHLMGGYPHGAIYDPYGGKWHHDPQALLASQQAAAAAAGIPPHPYAGK